MRFQKLFIVISFWGIPLFKRQGRGKQWCNLQLCRLRQQRATGQTLAGQLLLAYILDKFELDTCSLIFYQYLLYVLKML